MPPAPAAGNARVQAPPIRLVARRRTIADFFVRTWLGNVLAVIGLLFAILGVAWAIYTGVLSLRYGALQTCATLYGIGKYSGYCNKTLDAGVTPAPIMRRHSSGILFWRKDAWTAQDGYVVLYPDTPFWWQRLFASSVHWDLSKPSLAAAFTGWLPGIMLAAAALIIAVAIFAVISRRPSIEVQRRAFFDNDDPTVHVECSEIVQRTVWLALRKHVLPTGSNDVPGRPDNLQETVLDPAMIANEYRELKQRTAYVHSDDEKEVEDFSMW
ncbi:hypothetical protein LTR15_003260 [Elasticomyces elasticus]|nr:hypothetical protein LTR15_003260 [Elasticomyces elasticus]